MPQLFPFIDEKDANFVANGSYSFVSELEPVKMLEKSGLAAIRGERRRRANFNGSEFAPTNLAVYLNALVNDDHQSDPEPRRSLWERIKALFP